MKGVGFLVEGEVRRVEVGCRVEVGGCEASEQLPPCLATPSRTVSSLGIDPFNFHVFLFLSFFECGAINIYFPTDMVRLLFVSSEKS